jgi:hypothetical protein
VQCNPLWAVCSSLGCAFLLARLLVGREYSRPTTHKRVLCTILLPLLACWLAGLVASSYLPSTHKHCLLVGLLAPSYLPSSQRESVQTSRLQRANTQASRDKGECAAQSLAGCLFITSLRFLACALGCLALVCLLVCLLDLKLEGYTASGEGALRHNSTKTMNN